MNPKSEKIIGAIYIWALLHTSHTTKIDHNV